MAEVGDKVRLLPPFNKANSGVYAVLVVSAGGVLTIGVPVEMPSEFVEFVESGSLDPVVLPPAPVDLGVAQVLPPFDKWYPETYRVMAITADGGVALAVDGHVDGVGFGAEFVQLVAARVP